MEFAPGQRWYSLTEPELGLGRVEAVEGRQVVIVFPARDMVRRYAGEDPPLVRARLNAGQMARGLGIEFAVEEVVADGALLVYRGGGEELAERELDAALDVSTPENRLANGQVDDYRMFDMRHNALVIRHRMLSSPARGFAGGRIRLFDHQLSIARDVCERHRVRVLLADEVGLGKTIEALLILHRLLLTGRVETALILVPPALVHQWLAEAYLRFNLVLRVMGEGGAIDVEREDLPQQVLDAQLFVCPLGAKLDESFDQIEWDIAIVDEAHHLQPGSANFDLVAGIAARTEHVVFLSATPDRDGERAHFARLALLDAARFHDFAAYESESAHYRALAAVADRLASGEALDEADRGLLVDRLGDFDQAAVPVLLQRLLDLHGIGRVMFRNVRARIPGFPRRVFHSVDLKGGKPERWRREFLADIGRDESLRMTGADKDPRTHWLADFLAAHPDDKVLVLCATRAKVEAFAEALVGPKCPVARFHEQMGVIERDRQAAWFLDADGPQIVISSAIGAEGRNFQVARHLVLLDLPLSADRLEQAIGRVDRIGQGFEVHIHALAVPGTPQARLRRWYDQALDIFSRPWHGAPALAREFGAALEEALLAETGQAMDALLETGKERNAEIVAELEIGRDRLLELASFDGAAARRLQAALAAAEADGELESFMVDAFERSGLDVEALGDRSYAARAGLAYHRPFPGYAGGTMAVTFDRAVALAHPDRALLTWDHPMVRDCVDTLFEVGNAGVAQCTGPQPGLMLEALYVAEPTVAQGLRADRFFPPTPIRVLVDMDGAEVEIDAGVLRAKLEPTDSAVLEMPQVGELLPGLMERAREIALTRGPAIAQAARAEMRAELEPVVARLTELATVNPAVGAEEIAAAQSELAALDEGLQGVRVRLDGLRLILVAEE